MGVFNYAHSRIGILNVGILVWTFPIREDVIDVFEIAICDDDVAFVAEFQALLSDVMAERGAAYRLSAFSDPARLLHAVKAGEGFNLIFQDILFGSEKGLRYARLLRERDRNFEVVFVSTNPEYAVESFSAFPLSYLLKPITRARLAEVMDRFLEKRISRMLSLTIPRGTMRLLVSDVLFFEIYGHTIVIHLRDGNSRSWTGALKELEDILPPHCFVRSHRSYLVNLEHVVEFERTWLRLSSGDTIPVSKSAYPKVQASLVEYDDRKSQ